MIFPPSTELRASLSGCHAKIPDASPFSIRSIISLNTGRPGILAVCFSTKTSTTSSCSFNASSFNSLSWSEILRTCLSLSSVDLRVYMKNFLVRLFIELYWQTSEPRGARKNLLDSGIFGGNAFVFPPSRHPPFSFQFWRCVLDEVRMYFGQNPQDFDE